MKEKKQKGSLKNFMFFWLFRLRPNLGKNRYADVLCYDHSRVLLSQQDNDPNSDYINANYVDGYKQKNAFISTQGEEMPDTNCRSERVSTEIGEIFVFFSGPLQKTAPDFWRMVWEQNCLVIVMTTKVMERGRIKCYQYWEPEQGEAVHGNFAVRTTASDLFTDFTVCRLELVNLKVCEWEPQNRPIYFLGIDLYCLHLFPTDGGGTGGLSLSVHIVAGLWHTP